MSDGPESALHSGVNTIRYRMVPKTENFKAKLRLPSLHLPFLDGLGRLLHPSNDAASYRGRYSVALD